MKVYNSQTLKKEQFMPLEENIVKMYVCGITPYDTTHMGHAFTYIFFDTLKRYLEYKNYEVIYIQNVTDIDDDILKRAKEQSTDWKGLGDYWTKRFLKDMKDLNVCPPTNYVKATNAMDQIIFMVRELIKKGFAYEKSGNVYFDIEKFKEYGKLSHFNRNQMLLLSKERGGDPDDPLKKDPLDFILWQKPHLENGQLPTESKNEPAWRSPWGAGRPGWHIECSATIYKYLGEQIDIHGGGRDLIFPHHESEIAQSESYTEKIPFVKYWLHTAMVIHQGEKMSKSLGNLVMVSDLLKKYSANAIRYVLLSHHYRIPWEFDEIELQTAETMLKKITDALNIKSEGTKIADSGKYLKQFESYMDDDMNVPKVLILMDFLASFISKEKENINIAGIQETLKTCNKTLGFLAE